MSARSERFIRVLLQQIDGSYAIQGYVAIQPDGSALFQVPANTLYQFEVVNEYSKALNEMAGSDYPYQNLQRHQALEQVAEGEIQQFVGFHVNANQSANDSNRINNGAVAANASWPNTNGNIRANAAGDTMAQALNDYLAKQNIDSTEVKAGLEYQDYWTQAAGAASPSLAVDYQGITTAKPMSISCQENWSEGCIVNITYPAHIQPLWEKEGRGEADLSCVSCHDDGGFTRLNLRSDLNDENKLASYDRLFAREATYMHILNQFEAVNVSNCRRQVELPFATTPTNDCFTCYSQNLMSNLGAVQSGNFFDVFDEDSDDDHSFFRPLDSVAAQSLRDQHRGLLNASERRMISEWLDQGAPY